MKVSDGPNFLPSRRGNWLRPGELHTIGLRCGDLIKIITHIERGVYIYLGFYDGEEHFWSFEEDRVKSFSGGWYEDHFTVLSRFELIGDV